MNTTNNLGIWMDHSTAHLIDPQAEENNRTITSDFTSETKTETLNRSESTMHNKEQQMNWAYYKKIAVQVLKYYRVLLFGPTNAKVELRNYLEKDLHFKDVKIDVEPADKMTTNEQRAFVTNHFKNKKTT